MKLGKPAPGSTPIVSLLLGEAVSRGLLASETDLSPASAFALVRDMPYRRASSREPEAVVREWKGTCSGKHYLLRELFQELGYQVRIFMCTHRFTQENTGHFPAHLRAHLADGPVPDVHTYLRLRYGDGWTQVDATWPLAVERLGMRVNRRFQPGIDMKLACDPLEHFEVPADEEAQAFKERLIKSFCGPDLGRREQFIEGMGEWLGECTSQFPVERTLAT